MKTTYDTTTIQMQKFMAVTVPVFLPHKMEQPMANDATTQGQEISLSLFDVKELYDLAYAEKDKSGEIADSFKKLLAEAVKMDLAYRRQLSKASVYKDHTKLKNFNKATEGKNSGSKVA